MHYDVTVSTLISYHEGTLRTFCGKELSFVVKSLNIGLSMQVELMIKF